MAKNSSLNAASVAKQDEFYTQYKDIQNELNHYEKHFKDKTVLCNCDDPFESNFCKFFLRNFNYLGLKRLICTSYSTSAVIGRQMTLFDLMNEPVVTGNGYVMDVSEVPMANGRGVSDEDIDYLLKSKKRGVKKLKGDGDFRSEECIEYLKQADVVVTNPPFSLFREYIALLMKYDKKFLIIGNQNNVTYKEVFPLIQQNKIWLGCKFGDMAFRVPDHYEPRATRFWVDENGQKWRSFGTICWYTNLDHEKRHEKLILYKNYYGNEDEYPKYDDYDAINVNKVADIPKDYFEYTGNPTADQEQHNPQQDETLKYDENQKKNLTHTLEPATILTDRQNVTASWECQLHSLTSTTRSNLSSSDLIDMSQTIRDMDIDLQSTDEKHTQEFLSREKCSGVMGVPITFLAKYNPEQFEILGLANSARYIGDFPCYTVIDGIKIYNRILIKRRRDNEH